ncbi:MAG: tetratricopeptide repeat protein, partial [Spirochaetota bacterium]
RGGKRPLHAFVAVCVLMFIAGCSSLPDQPDEIRTARSRVSQLNEFGDNYYRRGQYEQARNFYKLGFDLARSVESLGQVGALHNAIGQTWQAEGAAEAAREEFDLALRIALRTENRLLEAESRTNLGKLELEAGRHGEARAVFQNALELLGDDPEFRSQEAVIRHNLGTAIAGEGDLEGGREQLQQALTLNEEGNFRFELASNNYMLASVASRAGDFEQAIRYAERALEIDRTMENTMGIISDLRALSRIAVRMNENDRAFEYLDRARSVAAGAAKETIERALLDELLPLAEELDHTDDVRRYRQRLEEL